MKKILRKKLLAERKKLLKKFVERASNRICAKLASSREFKAAKKILFYFPVRNEVDCMPAIERAFREGKKVFLPRIRGKEFQVVGVKNFGELEKMPRGAFGIPEPAGRKTALEKIGLIVVPGVAFDLQGHRLGYGKGFYDALLRRKKAGSVAAGLCYTQFLVEKLPVSKWDKRVNAIITENGVKIM